MTVLLGLIQSIKTSTVLEDAFLVVGTMAAALEQKFSLYIEAFLPLLYPALKAHEDTQLCTVAIGVIGDISRALGDQSAKYADAFMGVLWENLQSETLNRNVKIPILSCFGDIALAIGPAFRPYLETTMNILRQAGAVMPNPVSQLHDSPSSRMLTNSTQMDYELLDYVTQLREGILEAYTGIVTGFKNTDDGKHCSLVLLTIADHSDSQRIATSRPIHAGAGSALLCG